eukprot:9494877-Pyramimonas_sp.AAC.1
MQAFYHMPIALLEMGGTRRPIFLVSSGAAQGCPLVGTIWALIFDPALIGINDFFKRIQGGIATACADDLGCVLACPRGIEGLRPHLLAIAQHSGLHLQPRKCVLVPVWTIASSDLVDSLKDTLGHIHADWALFKIGSSAKYLGVVMCPGADERAQWAAPAAKWLHRAQILGEPHAPIQHNITLYNSSALTTLSYVSQFFPAPDLSLSREIHLLHKIIRSPPSAFTKLDIL